MLEGNFQAEALERTAMRRITLRLIPFLCICYLAAFLDRVNVSFARVQMMRDLNFTDKAYGLGAGIFFFGYFLFEIPSNLIMEKVGARIWIARIMVLWGVISFCMMFAANATQYCVLRFLLGAAEAGFFPGIILYLTYWFPSAYRSRTIAVFMTAAVMSSVVGSPLSSWLLQLGGTLGLRGWQWLFIVEALPSIALGAVVLVLLPNGPRQAKWLPEAEREWLEKRLHAERQTLATTRPPTLGSALAQPRVVLSCLAYFTLCMGGYGLDFYQPTLVRESFGSATLLAVGFINAVPPLLALFAMVFWGRSSDHRAERKFHFAAAIWVAAAGLLLASLRLPPLLALAALTIAVSGRWSSVAPFWGFTSSFLSGTAAAGAIALINSVGNLGGFAGPYLMGWFKDLSGDHRIGLRVLAAAMFVGGFIVLRVQSVRASAPAAIEPEPA